MSFCQWHVLKMLEDTAPAYSRLFMRGITTVQDARGISINTIDLRNDCNIRYIATSIEHRNV